MCDVVVERDLGATVSMQIVAMQQLGARHDLATSEREAMQIEIDDKDKRIKVLEDKIAVLESN